MNTTPKQNSLQAVSSLPIDQLQKIFNGNMTIQELEWLNSFTPKERKAFMEKYPKKEIFLKLLSGNETLMLDAVDGTQTIDNSKIFNHIDPDFQARGTNKHGNANGEICVDVYEMIKDTRFNRMFGSLSLELDKLCLEQGHILNFITKHKNWLRSQGFGTFFLFKVKNQYFVSETNFYYSIDSRRALLYNFEDERIWDAESRRRIVIPRLDVL